MRWMSDSSRPVSTIIPLIRYGYPSLPAQTRAGQGEGTIRLRWTQARKDYATLQMLDWRGHARVDAAGGVSACLVGRHGLWRSPRSSPRRREPLKVSERK